MYIAPCTMSPRSFLIIYSAFFFAEWLWESLLVLLNLRYVRDQLKAPPEEASALMEPQSFKGSVEYALVRGRFGLLSSTLSNLLLLSAILSGALGTLEGFFTRLEVGAILQGILTFASFSLILQLLSLPLSLYSQFVIEERFGFNRMTVRLFFLDALKGLLLSLALAVPLLAALFWLMDAAGSLWWLWAFGVLAAFQLALIVLYPAVIAPWFNRFTPLEDSPLREKILGLAERLRFGIKGIFVMDGSKRSVHSNAYFSGLGTAKRIVLFDTLLRNLGEDQILAVLAHEIGHEKKHHLEKSLSVSLAGTLAGLWLASLALKSAALFQAFGFLSPSAAAALILISFYSGPFTFFLKPLFSFWSRRHEYEADRFSAQALQDSGALREALIRLNRENLSTLAPHPWYSFFHYSHPALLERLRALEHGLEESPVSPKGI